MKLINLNPDCILKITEFLDDKESLRISLTNKYLRDCITERYAIKQYFHPLFLNLLNGDSFIEQTYKKYMLTIPMKNKKIKLFFQKLAHDHYYNSSYFSSLSSSINNIPFIVEHIKIQTDEYFCHYINLLERIENKSHLKSITILRSHSRNGYNNPDILIIDYFLNHILYKFECLEKIESHINLFYNNEVYLDFHKFPHLKEVSLFEFSYFYETQLENISLKKLSINGIIHNHTRSGKIVFPENLEMLNLENSTISHLNEIDISNCNSLKTLILSNTEIDEINHDFPKSLKYLFINKTTLKKINFKKLPEGLEELYLVLSHLNDVDLENIPKSLKKLDLSFSNIKSIVNVDNKNLDIYLYYNNSTVYFANNVFNRLYLEKKYKYFNQTIYENYERNDNHFTIVYDDIEVRNLFRYDTMYVPGNNYYKDDIDVVL